MTGTHPALPALVFHAAPRSASWLAQSKLACAAALVCSLVSESAAAAEPADPPPGNREESRQPTGAISVAVLAGWNHGDEVGAGGYRTLFGRGVRAGYSFATTRLYLGFTVVHYKHEYEQDDSEYGREDVTDHLVHVDFDIGSELGAGPLFLRPYLGVGAVIGIHDASNGNSGIFPELVPGLHIRYPLGPVDFGADARLELGWEKTAALLGSVGARF